MRTIAIIPSGGKGIRSGLSAPKQYLKFNGKELLVYTLETFQNNKLIDEIFIAAKASYFTLLDELKHKYNLSKITKFVEGGNERQDSVFNALKSIDRVSPGDLIAVHDAARPLLPQKVLIDAINAAKEKGNAVVCIKAKDTLIKADKFIHSYLDRNEVYYVQTPQIFPYEVLMKAMKSAYDKGFTGTDESMLVKQLGEKINIVEGSVYNFKITTSEDVDLFDRLISH